MSLLFSQIRSLLTGMIAMLACLFCGGTSLAQPFKKVPGTISNTIYHIFQDSEGFIWTGSKEGASRYDGYEWLHLVKENGLTDHSVYKIAEDHKRRIWILTNNGIPSIYDRDSLRTPQNMPLLRGIHPNSPGLVLMGQGDELWYVARSTAYHIVNDSIWSALPAATLAGHPSNYIGAYYDKGQIRLVCTNGIYDRSGQVLLLFGDESICSAIAKMVKSGDRLYISNDYKIVVADLATHRISSISPPDKELILCLLPAKDNRFLWVCTSAHIYRLDMVTGNCLPAMLMPVSWCSYVLEDRRGNTWIGSLTHGLYLAQVIHAVHPLEYTTRTGLKAPVSLGRYGHTLFAGFDDGEWVSWNNGWQKSYRALHSEALKCIRHFDSVQQGLWIPGDGLLMYYDLHTGKVTEYNGAVKMTAVADHYMFVAVSDRIFRVHEDSINYYRDNLYGAPLFYKGRASAMLPAGQGKLYLGSADGLLLSDHTPVTTGGQYKISSGISSIIRMHNGAVAFSSLDSGAGMLWKGQYYPISRQQGLSSNTCFCITEDMEGDLWVGSVAGIDKIECREQAGQLHFRVVPYSVQTGTQKQRVNDLLWNRDSLWIAGAEGLCIYVKDTVQQEIPLKTYIQSVRINDSTVVHENAFSLDYHSRRFSFYFTAPYFSGSTVMYRYRLSGLEEDWHYTELRSATYAYVPPGKYIFMVQAKTPFSTWSDIPATLRLRISPPVWQTPWFIALMILAGISVFVAIARLILKSVQNKEQLVQQSLKLAKEKAEYEKELSELQQKALRLQMNPHFLFNAINAIQGFYASGDKQTAKWYVTKFSSLLRMVMDTGNGSMISLEKEMQMLRYYLELVAVRMQNAFDFRIEWHGSTPAADIYIPSMIVQPFVENAVIHGVAPLESGGQIDIDFYQDTDEITCTVQDNGVGRQQAALMKDRHTFASQGISITEKRLSLLSHQRTAVSLQSIQIKDLADDSGQSCGTRVIIKMPYKKHQA